MENKSMTKLELQTPCFIFDEYEFKNNINNFKQVLLKYFNSSIIGYSFKTNSLPRLLYLVKELGCYAEVVSDGEYQLAEMIGFPQNHIIFNGPVKGEKMFQHALEGESLINIDSKREIDWLLGYHKTKPVNIGIRVNFDLESMLPGQTSTGNKGGRFGFCYENGELQTVFNRLKCDKNINITRLHMHVSNASKSVEVYEYLARMACKIIDDEDLDISCIDFGGGYFGGGDNGGYYETYISKIYEVLKYNNNEKISVIVEPGASVAATAFSYLSTVIDKKETTYGRFIVTDGTRLHIDPFMAKSNYDYDLLPRRNGEGNMQVICGYTCMEKDRIMEINDVLIETGDRIEYKIVGSYSMCFNALFISYLPNVYSKTSSGTYKIVRNKWGIKEYIQGSRWKY